MYPEESKIISEDLHELRNSACDLSVCCIHTGVFTYDVNQFNFFLFLVTLCSTEKYGRAIAPNRFDFSFVFSG